MSKDAIKAMVIGACIGRAVVLWVLGRDEWGWLMALSIVTLLA